MKTILKTLDSISKINKLEKKLKKENDLMYEQLNIILEELHNENQQLKQSLDELQKENTCLQKALAYQENQNKELKEINNQLEERLNKVSKELYDLKNK